jgi:hypothetical protein
VGVWWKRPIQRKFAYTDFSWPPLPIFGGKNVFLSPGKDTFHVGVLSLAFRKKNEG